jgi:hypothetical protein
MSFPNPFQHSGPADLVKSMSYARGRGLIADSSRTHRGDIADGSQEVAECLWSPCGRSGLEIHCKHSHLSRSPSDLRLTTAGPPPALRRASASSPPDIRQKARAGTLIFHADPSIPVFT